jgi:hypothetical protein
MNENFLNNIFNDIFFRICILSIICFISEYNCYYGLLVGVIFIFILSYTVYTNIYINQEYINNYYKYDLYLKNI